MDVDYLQSLLNHMSSDGHRFDADATHHLARQLEHVRSQTYDIKFPELKFRQLIPVDSSVSPAANTVTYRQWEMFGAAAIVSNYADDSPRVDLLVEEFSGTVRSLADSYGYSIQDLRAASASGISLPAEKANTARRGMEQTMDQLSAFGDAAYNLPGFLNFANVPIVAVPNGNWPALLATPGLILEDLNHVPTQIRVLTNTVHSGDTTILDTASFDLVATTPLDPANGSNITVASAFIMNNPYIKDLDQWYRLDTAGPASTPRMMNYERRPENVQVVIPLEFEQFAPQERNLEFVINCHARHGGVEWRYPLSAAYTDNHDA